MISRVVIAKLQQYTTDIACCDTLVVILEYSNGVRRIDEAFRRIDYGRRIDDFEAE